MSEERQAKPRRQKSQEDRRVRAPEDDQEERNFSQQRSMAQLSKWSDQQQDTSSRPNSTRREQTTESSRPEETPDDNRGFSQQRSMAQLSRWSETQEQTQKPPRKEKSDDIRLGALEEEDDPTSRMAAQRSMAQLSKWSDSQESITAGQKERVVKSTVSIGGNKSSSRTPAPAPAPAPKSKADTDGYDDDFEDYDEDFEEEEEPVPAPAPAPKPAPKATASSKASKTVAPVAAVVTESISAEDLARLRESVEQENSEALLRKQQKSSVGGEQKKRSGSTSQPSVDKPSPDKVSTTAAAQPKPSMRRAKKFGSMSMSMTGSLSMDPRGRRLARLFASGVLDMQEEKFGQFNMAPSTPYDLYHRMLRAQSASIRQIGVPIDEETREIEIGTDEIITADKEVQFCYGDDTALLNSIKDIELRRQQKRVGGSQVGNSVLEEMKSGPDGTAAPTTVSIGTFTTIGGGGGGGGLSGTGSGGGDGAGEDFSGRSSSRLASFLQRASLLCETLLEEDRQRREERTKGASSREQRQSMFDVGCRWTPFGDGVNGANELIRQRRVVAARFSPLQPNLLLTAHPHDLDGDGSDDLRPLKGLFCIWDVLSPGAPSYILESSGVPVSCCFSGAQTYLVLGGSAEGTLSLWDLREPSSVHKDRDAMDLGIERGIRKPCYSTPLMVTAQNELDVAQHSSAIIQVEALGMGDYGSTVASAVSQFVSLDVCGVMILWVTSEGAGPDSLTADSTTSPSQSYQGDFGLSPWGRVSLVQTRVLRIDEVTNLSSHGAMRSLSSSRHAVAGGTDGPRSPSGPGGAGGGGGGFGGGRPSNQHLQSSAVMATIPGDVSSLLAAAPRGKVCRVVRFGASSALGALDRHYAGDKVEVRRSAGGGDSKSSESAASPEETIQFYSNVTCIAVRDSMVPAGGRRSSASSGDSSVDDDSENVRFSSEEKKSGETMSTGGAAKEGDDEGGVSATSNKRASLQSASSSSRAGAVDVGSPLVLVGRRDGSVDLYQIDVDAPLQSWSLSNFDVGDKGSQSGGTHSQPQSPPVVMVKWCPRRPSAFLTADAAGSVYFFDLLQNPFAPIFVESVPAKKLTPNTIDISRPRPGSNVVYALSAAQEASGRGGMAVQVRRLNDVLLRPFGSFTGGISDTKGATGAHMEREEVQLRAAMSSWVARTSTSQAVAVMGGR